MFSSFFGFRGPEAGFLFLGTTYGRRSVCWFTPAAAEPPDGSDCRGCCGCLGPVPTKVVANVENNKRQPDHTLREPGSTVLPGKLRQKTLENLETPMLV